MGVPQIMQNETIFVLKPMALGIPHFKNPLYVSVWISQFHQFRKYM